MTTQTETQLSVKSSPNQIHDPIELEKTLSTYDWKGWSGGGCGSDHNRHKSKSINTYNSNHDNDKEKIKAPEIEGIRAQEQGHDNLYDIYVVNNLIEI